MWITAQVYNFNMAHHVFENSYCSVGKSTLLTMLTGTHSEAASYEFTTLTCIPGIIHYNDTKIQLLDLPGIIEGASEGKGRGRQVSTVFGLTIVIHHTCL
jgi:small GTP-binding protein